MELEQRNASYSSPPKSGLIEDMASADILDDVDVQQVSAKQYDPS